MHQFMLYLALAATPESPRVAAILGYASMQKQMVPQPAPSVPVKPLAPVPVIIPKVIESCPNGVCPIIIPYAPRRR